MRESLRDLYFRRLLRQAASYRGLLALSIGAGLVNLSLTFVFPWLIGSMIDRVVAPVGNPPPMGERHHWLMVLVAIGAGTAMMFAIVTYARGHYTVKLGNRLVADLRRDLFEHLQRLSLHFYSHERTGTIMSRLINDIQEAANIVNGGVILVVMDLVQTLVAIALLFATSWRLMLACAIVIPLYALTFRAFNHKVRRASRLVQQQISHISGSVQERLAGIALVKANAAEERERLRFRADTEEHYGRVVRQSSIAHLIAAISEGLVHIGTVIVIGYGSYLSLYGHPRMTAGDITRFLGYLGIMYGPVRRFADLNVIYQTSLSAIERVFEVFDITPKIVEKPHCITHPPVTGHIVFEHVSFGYDLDDSDESRVCLDRDDGDADFDASCDRDDADAERMNGARRRPRPATGLPRLRTSPPGKLVLKDLDFAIEPGERVALVGPSGSGKSTLVSLLPRLYDVTGGRILVDGTDLRDFCLRPLREAVAVVQQDSFVFTGTVRENLCYGRPRATLDEMVAAAKAAHAHDFIMALPQGYDSMLGERGVNLSGGQRQRLSIARALLKDPKILILDEATSALDTESERLVQAALDRLMRGRTCFIIAHRLSTVRGADRLLVLNDGRIVEQGSHDALLAQNGLYARLVRQQFGAAPVPEPPPIILQAG